MVGISAGLCSVLQIGCEPPSSPWMCGRAAMSAPAALGELAQIDHHHCRRPGRWP
jgi:hypothetical protein